MPLFILGLLLLIGLLIYSIFRYMESGEEDSRPVRERYPHVFVRRYDQDDDQEPITNFESYVDQDSFMGDIDHIRRKLRDEIKTFSKNHGLDSDKSNEEDDYIVFPTDNIEEEKKKRNIKQ